MKHSNILGFAALAVANPMNGNGNVKAFEARDTVERLSDSNFQDMKFYTQHAAAAYCNFDKSPGHIISCKNNACPLVTQNQAKIVAATIGKSTGMAAYVAVDTVRNETVVSFRGTNNWRSVFADIKFPKIDCSLVEGCKVHSGFAQSWDEIKSEITKAVNDARKENPSYKLVITGHSLGGAVATLASAYYRKDDIPLDVYTYGSPRVGNDKFADFVSNQKGPHWRVTHGNDPIPRLPFADMGFAHTTPEYWVTGGSASDTVDLGRQEYKKSEVKVCHGIFSGKCNSRYTMFNNILSHLAYLGNTDGCADLIFGMRDTTEADVYTFPKDLKEELEQHAKLEQEFLNKKQAGI